MNQCPKISIIVPIYKTEQYLQRCIDSILAQTFTNFELLLIEDGSPDNSGKICDKYALKDSRIKVYHKENGGVSSARNLGLDHATGEWITFCDSDDWVNKDWLELFILNSNTDMVIQSYYVSTITNPEKIKQLKNKNYSKINFNNLFDDLIDINNLGYLWCRLFKNRIIQEYNIRFNPQYKICEDQEFIFKYLKYTQHIVTLEKGAYHYLEPDYEKKYKGLQDYQTNILLEKSILNNTIEILGYTPNKLLLNSIQSYLHNIIKLFSSCKDIHMCQKHKQYIKTITLRSKLFTHLDLKYQLFLIFPLNIIHAILKKMQFVKFLFCI